MNILITENKEKSIIGVDFYRINYEMISRLLDYLGIKQVSIFIDDSISYKFYKTINISELAGLAKQLNESLLIFDGTITRCDLDQELSVLSYSKIMINLVPGEHFTSVLINTKKVDATYKDVKDFLKR